MIILVIIYLPVFKHLSDYTGDYGLSVNTRLAWNNKVISEIICKISVCRKLSTEDPVNRQSYWYLWKCLAHLVLLQQYALRRCC